MSSEGKQRPFRRAVSQQFVTANIDRTPKLRGEVKNRPKSIHVNMVKSLIQKFEEEATKESDNVTKNTLRNNGRPVVSRDRGSYPQQGSEISTGPVKILRGVTAKKDQYNARQQISVTTKASAARPKYATARKASITKSTSLGSLYRQNSDIGKSTSQTKKRNGTCRKSINENLNQTGAGNEGRKSLTLKDSQKRTSGNDNLIQIGASTEKSKPSTLKDFSKQKFSSTSGTSNNTETSILSRRPDVRRLSSRKSVDDIPAVSEVDRLRLNIQQDIRKKAQELGVPQSVTSFDNEDDNPSRLSTVSKKPMPLPRMLKGSIASHENAEKNEITLDESKQEEQGTDDSQEDPLLPLLSHLHRKPPPSHLYDKETQTPCERSTQTPKEFEELSFTFPIAEENAPPLPPRNNIPSLCTEAEEVIANNAHVVDSGDGLAEKFQCHKEFAQDDVYEDVDDDVYEEVENEESSRRNVQEETEMRGIPTNTDNEKLPKIVLDVGPEDITNYLEKKHSFRKDRSPSSNSSTSSSTLTSTTLYTLIFPDDGQYRGSSMYENVNIRPERTVNDRGIRTVTYFDAQQNPVISIPETNNERSPSPNSPKSKIEHVIKEIIETEKTYVSRLRTVVEHYIPVVTNRNVPSNLLGKKGVIFGNIEKILENHTKFLAQLENSPKSPKSIADVFLNNREIFAHYSDYFKNKPKSVSVLENYGAEIFKKIKAKLKDSLDLNTYLLKPIQRYPQYRLLLEQLKKQLKGEESVKELDEALKMIKTGLTRANGLMHIDSILNCDINLNDEGEFKLTDKFTITKPKRCEETLFLFERILVFTVKDPKDETLYNYKDSIRLDQMGIVILDNEELSFDLHKFGKVRRHDKNRTEYSLEANNSKQKLVWTKAITSLLWEQLIIAKEHQETLNKDQGKLILHEKQSINSCTHSHMHTLPQQKNRKSEWYACLECEDMNAHNIKKT